MAGSKEAGMGQGVNFFVDDYGQYHVEPCNNGRPSSNDGLIMTAVAHKMGLPVDESKIHGMWYKLRLSPYLLPKERFPLKGTPYPSRDFFLAAYYFFECIPENWIFSPVELPRFNPFKTIASFILAIGEHRNFLWKHDLRHSYKFMFSVPLSDRWYYLESPNWFYRFIKFFDSKLKGGKSSCLVRYLKYGTINMDHFEEYFHPYLDNPVYLRAKELHESK